MGCLIMLLGAAFAASGFGIIGFILILIGLCWQERLER